MASKSLTEHTGKRDDRDEDKRPRTRKRITWESEVEGLEADRTTEMGGHGREWQAGKMDKVKKRADGQEKQARLTQINQEGHACYPNNRLFNTRRLGKKKRKKARKREDTIKKDVQEISEDRQRGEKEELPFGRVKHGGEKWR